MDLLVNLYSRKLDELRQRAEGVDASIRTALPPRSNSWRPSLSSISAIWLESAGWLTPASAAARPKCSVRASASKYSICLTVSLIIMTGYRNEQQMQFGFIDELD